MVVKVFGRNIMVIIVIVCIDELFCVIFFDVFKFVELFSCVIILNIYFFKISIVFFFFDN